MISIPGKIPIHIFPFFWLLILMIGWLNSASLLGTLIWAAVILLSILVHEFGHALTAMLFGQSAEINLVGMGGVTHRQGGKIASWKEFLVVLNGPLAGFLLFFAIYLIAPTLAGMNPVLVYACEVGLQVNLFWTFLNLVPVLPLDGGHLIRILLEGFFGLKGLKAALFISVLVAAALGLLFLMQQQILVGALFLMFGFESYKSWSEMRTIHVGDTDKDLQAKFKEAVSHLKMGKRDQALSEFFALKDQAPQGVLRVAAIEHIALLLSEEGHYQAAYGWLDGIRDQLSPESLCLQQQLAYKLEEWEATTIIGLKAFQSSPSSEVAVLNALAFGIMGRADPAIGWLRCAIQVGLANPAQLISRREFDAVRNHPEFQKLKTAQGV